MSISAFQVKELREITGAGMMDCKVALLETSGDVDAAISFLRKKGIANADKKANRVAAEGLIGAVSDGNEGVIVEVNTETDFVTSNNIFQEIVRNIARTTFETDGSLEAVSFAIYPGSSQTVSDTVKNAIATLGENISVRRVAKLKVESGVVATYLHNSVSKDLGKIGVLVALETDGDKGAVRAFGHQIAMHVAARNPLALTTSDIDSAIIEQEREILFDQARQSGKPENIVNKIVDGRLYKFYEEVTLLSQAFVMNPDRSVREALDEIERLIGSSIRIKGYVRFALGEGIEKRKTNFSAEIAAAIKG